MTMTLIYRYVLSEIGRFMGLMLVMVLSIYLAVDFFERIDDFIEVGLPMGRAATYFFFKTPLIISQVLPVCLLLAVLIVFGLMTKNNEIIALKSSGISVYYLVTPVVGLGVLLSLLLFFLAEVVVPQTQTIANRIWFGEVRNESSVFFRQKNIWIKASRSIIHIHHYEPARKTMNGLTINRFDEDFNLIRRVDAKKAVYENDRWMLLDAMVQVRSPENGQFAISKYRKSVTEKLEITPEDLKQVVKKAEEMSFKELFSHIRKVESEGYDATSNRVDLYAKIAFPFVCIIMSLVGAGIALRARLREGLPVSITYGIVVAFGYWVFHSFCVSLGYGEMIPAPLAAWTANLVFLCIGAYLLLIAE